MPAVTRGDELELTVDSLAYGGRGVARHGELVVFVARALPGDRVRARVTKYKRRYAEARAVELLEAGPGRVEAPCPHFGVCGGCAWQDLEYARQLEHKQAQVVDALERLGRLEGYELLPIEPATQQFGYRNKLEYSWSSGPDGPSLGFHVAGRWDQLLPIDRCLIAGDPSNRAREACRAVGAGGRRRAVRPALGLRIPAPPGDPRGPPHGRPAGRAGHRSGRAAGRGAAGGAAGRGRCDRRAARRERRRVGGDRRACRRRRWRVEPAFRERILDIELELSAGAFMQTNTEMCDVLYGHALAYADLRPDDVVWDLYCGAGAIGLLAARHAGRLVGVEISGESVESARRNAVRNGVENAEFIEGDVSKELRRLLELAERPSVVFVDPPRAGLSPKAVRRVIELAPERLVYVSCNPTTLAPNAAQLAEGGYRLERVQPVDMFPHTHHIECVARFTRA